ncbi:hypothetical protein [Sabulibacter ruber]|uniref:hypothetical protein n=1 Tax=Sabulibacter ruber TaxID=2811901 RepID=UPI001A97C170|nr:hypothetical protein [Sabulibacter ruber]
MLKIYFATPNFFKASFIIEQLSILDLSGELAKSITDKAIDRRNVTHTAEDFLAINELGIQATGIANNAKK